METDYLILIIASLIAVGFMRYTPRNAGPNLVAAWSLGVLIAVSWISAIWLISGMIANLIFMKIGDQSSKRGLVLCVAITFHSALLLYMRELPNLLLLGGAYFTLRHIHVIAEWWIDPNSMPTYKNYLRYQLFLPVLAAGPIHRCAPFLRQISRRRNDLGELLEGSERLLFGVFQYTFLGSWLMNKIVWGMEVFISVKPFFIGDLIFSALDWISLYFLFSGISSIAIGLSLMMGIRIEENFNSPWRARSLPDFWSRWHMSLTSFSRDYVFRPVSIKLSSNLLGAFFAMLFIGIWHGSSISWVLWGFWQGIGVLLTVYFRGKGVFSCLPRWMGWVFAALWLVATEPMVSRISEVI